MIKGRANEGELLLAEKNRLRSAVLSGDVQFERVGTQPMQGTAGRVTFGFSPGNELKTIRADKGVRLAQVAAADASVDAAKADVLKVDAKNAKGAAPQNFELVAPVVDFTIADGRRLQRAVTSGKGQITISSVQTSASGSELVPQRPVATAGKFAAH